MVLEVRPKTLNKLSTRTRCWALAQPFVYSVCLFVLFWFGRKVAAVLEEARANAGSPLEAEVIFWEEGHLRANQ